MKKLFFLAMFSTLTILFGQEKLVVNYHFTYDYNTEGITDQKIKDFIKETNETTGEYTLITTKKESSFSKVQKINNSQSSNSQYGMSAPSRDIYTNMDENYYLEFIDFMGKSIIVKDSLKTFKWVIEKEKSKILGYEVRKAVFRKDKMTYEAWYAPQLAYRNGPNNMAGLPGLILKLTEISPSKNGLNKTHYVATAVTIDETAKINKPSKGEIMSYQEYQKILEDFFNRAKDNPNVEHIQL